MGDSEKDPLKLNFDTKVQLEFPGATIASEAGLLAALVDELGVTVSAVEKWKAGDAYPQNVKEVLPMLDQRARRKRIPKKRRHAPGSRRRGGKTAQGVRPGPVSTQ